MSKKQEKKFIKLCEEGKVNEISRIIGLVNVEFRDEEGKTGFMKSCEKGNLEVVKFLFDKIDVNSKNNRG